jgi:general secretion pathway protein D
MIVPLFFFSLFLATPAIFAAAPNVVIDMPVDTPSPEEQMVTEDLSAKPEDLRIPLLAPDETVVTQSNQITELKENNFNSTDASIYLNFEGAALSSILNYLGEQKKINVIPHKDLEGVKVSLSTRNAMTIDQAWDVLLTLMEANSFSLIKGKDMYRVVPAANNGQEVLPVYSSYSNTEPENLPDNDSVIRYIYFLKNMRTDTARGILEKMVDGKNIIDNKDLNALIIKDTSLNIKAAFKIIKELDLGGLREAIEIIPLVYTSADYVKKVFSDITGNNGETQQDRILRFSGIASQRETSYFSTQTKIIPEPIRNKIILLGTQKNINRIKKFIAEHVDTPIQNASSRLHVKELRYIKAQDIKPILEDIVRPPKTATEKSLVAEDGIKIFEDVIISAEQDDENGSSGWGSGNRLIVAANTDDWRRLEEFIDKLDKPQPQVAIEAMIVDVNINQIRNLGTQVFNLKGKGFGDGINAEFLNLDPSNSRLTDPTKSYLNIANNQNEGSSPSYVTLGSTNNIWGLIKTTFNINNTQVISQPFQIVNNNQECVVSVDETRLAKGGIETKALNVAVQKFEPVTAKIEAKITPYINLSGNIDLTIEVTANDFTEAASNTSGADTISRYIKTKTSMATGEVIVLGGLKKSSQKETAYKTPVLSDIPIIGSLFQSKNKTKAESNLYIFIRPSVIKPQQDDNLDEYTQLKLDYAKYQIMKTDTYVKNKDPIQRFYFKPAHQSIRNRLADAAEGVLRPIDDFAYGRTRPKTVHLNLDPYFKVQESLERAKKERKLAQAAKEPDKPIQA